MMLSDDDFAVMMQAVLPDVAAVPSIAVGVSGGPDSMALCFLLNRWALARGIHVHAIIVDHGLRPESATEALAVSKTLGKFLNNPAVILRWEGEKPQSRILETARHARYGLIADYMKTHGVKHLFLAHHQDDQAETFLIRLAKGSGLDGLAAMKKCQPLEDEDVILYRPLLDTPKQSLIALCESQAIDFVKDPSNENEAFLRPRLRASRAVLEEEGLSAKRLAVTAARLARAREALDLIARETFEVVRREDSMPEALWLDWAMLSRRPFEIVLRVISLALEEVLPQARDYTPRMEKLEALIYRLKDDMDFKGATLGGCRFILDRKATSLRMSPEQTTTQQVKDA